MTRCSKVGAFLLKKLIRPDVTRHLEEHPRGDLGWGRDGFGTGAMADEVIRREADDDADEVAV
jgi:hypothetical protein